MSKIEFARNLAGLCDHLTLQMIYSAEDNETKNKMRVSRDLYSQVRNLLNNRFELDEIHNYLSYKLYKLNNSIKNPKQEQRYLYKKRAINEMLSQIEDYM